MRRPASFLLTSCTCTCLAQVIAFSLRDWENLVWFQQDSVPSVVNLIGSKADLSSTTLAQRLAKKTNKQCFVSYNIPTETMLLSLVEQRIKQEIKDKPQLFWTFQLNSYGLKDLYAFLRVERPRWSLHSTAAVLLCLEANWFMNMQNILTKRPFQTVT